MRHPPYHISNKPIDEPNNSVLSRQEKIDDIQNKKEIEEILKQWDELQKINSKSCQCHVCTQLRKQLFKNGSWKECY